MDGIEHCIDDEIPFEIPETWEWIRLGSLFTINPRNNIADDTVVGFMPMPLLKDGFHSGHTYETKLWKGQQETLYHCSVPRNFLQIGAGMNVDIPLQD